jgi:hypothetical protein
VDNIAEPNAALYLVDKKWQGKANPQAAALEKHYIDRDKFLLEKRRFQKILQ